MMIGVCEDFTYSEDSLLSGVYFSHTHLGNDEYKSRMVLKTGDQVCFETDYYKNAGGDWTSETTVGLHDGTTDIRGKEATFFQSRARIEAYTLLLM